MTIASLLVKVETQERHFAEEKEKASLQSKILASEKKSGLLARRVEEGTAEYHKYKKTYKYSKEDLEGMEQRFEQLSATEKARHERTLSSQQLETERLRGEAIRLQQIERELALEMGKKEEQIQQLNSQAESLKQLESYRQLHTEEKKQREKLSIEAEQFQSELRDKANLIERMQVQMKEAQQQNQKQVHQLESVSNSLMAEKAQQLKVRQLLEAAQK